jgi:asparagine synthetase B (glutamine-hydrolysing)
MTGRFLYWRPKDGVARLAIDGCRQATAGPIRLGVLGRPFTWERARPDIDAEVAELARRIAAQGLERALEPLDGEWGLVIEDARDGSASFVNDHVGTHPVFLAETSAGVGAASHLPDLVREARLGLDEDRVAVFLSRGKKDTLQPMFAGARRMVARRVVTLDAKGVLAERVWMEWDRSGDDAPDFGDLRDFILGAIARESASLPRPIGATLSAGLDSSVLCVALKSTPGFTAYSIDAGPKVDNEMSEIDETVRLTGIRHTYVPAAFGLDELHALVEACGEPIRELKSLSTMHSCAMRARADGMGSFLLGLGPDMIFAGAQMLVIPYLDGLIRRGRWGELARAIPGLAPYHGAGLAGILPRYVHAVVNARRHGGELRLPGRPSDGAHLKPAFARAHPLMRPIDLKGFITRLLSVVAISSSVRALETLTGLEVAAPLYSRRLATYTLGRHPRHFMAGGAGKAMMRKALEDVLPRHIAWARVKKKVPHKSVGAIVFEPAAVPAIEDALGASAVLRRMLAMDPAADFRRCLALRQDAEFWMRCVQIARLERLALSR